ncbi:hypothetical protein MKJ04_08470 [Pontibacter sp. E15-1]|uniref:hypothetical protein n=1 Tax=Pontibacter sp. E15-1 TaxID=2919918 RepID=UPI001F5025EE|nr:hypothetical protein [Pontibacter sp. E15-1]MCJ8164876.1 hypothetical protein [Pontibacter sp. E15-1]
MKRSYWFILKLWLAFGLSFPLLAQPDVRGDGAVLAVSTVAQAEKGVIFENPLYRSEEILEFQLNLNYKDLLDDRGEDPGYHQGTLTYTDATRGPVSVNLKVKVRGNHRRNPLICRFPPLLLNFSRKTTSQTVFEHVNKVKLVTHCLQEEYVLREYQVYKLYNVLTDKSFRVRLCRVRYEDLEGKRKSETRYAFLIEDDDEMAQRHNGVIVPKALAIGMQGTDQGTMAQLAIFQYMIGNTDWSVPYRHNIKLLSLDSLAPPHPVPYDFDFNGMVDPPYAVPPPELGIATVQQRLYRGYDFPEHVYAAVVQVFKARRRELYGVYRKRPLLSKSSQKRALRFLDSFYKTIDDPKDFERNIVRVGRENQKSYVTVKGLK